MGEAMASPAVQTQVSTASTDPAAQVAAQPEADSGRKRKLDLEEFRNSGYFKLRCLVKDLRPLFVEILQAPDVRSSNVAHDIQNEMKMMTELLQKLWDKMASSEKLATPSENNSSFQLKKEGVSEKHDPEKLTTSSENKLPNQIKYEEVTEKQQQASHAAMTATVKTEAKVPQTDGGQGSAPQGVNSTEIKENAKQLDVVSQGTYVIGGSKLGWNFLAYPGGKPVYYGVTKESALAQRATK